MERRRKKQSTAWLWAILNVLTVMAVYLEKMAQKSIDLYLNDSAIIET